MQKRLCLALAAIVATVALGAQQRAPQYRVPPLTDLSGAPGLSLALRKLNTIGTLMHATAHPDDENNGMLALYARHLGMRVALVSATRGDGGQNEIGPELFDALGILRTEELLAAHQFDGAEQYFTRAVDFGYSFSPEETFEKWGRQEILGDFVRHIRTLRPDVMVTLGVDGTGGGQHHQASGVIAAEAYKAAADPAQFPEQIKAGLRPWQVRKLYRVAGGFGRGRGGPPPGGRGAANVPAQGRGDLPAVAPIAPGAGAADPAARYATIDTSVYEPLLGCTIGEVGGVASGMHMCQGRAPLVPPPAASGARYRLVETVLANQRDKDESSLFEGIDTSLMGLTRFAGSRQSDALVRGLAIASAHVANAIQALGTGGPSATVQPLVYGLSAIRELRSNLATAVESDEGRYEIDFRLAQKEEQFQDALVLAQSLRIDAIANDGLIVPGQPLSVTVAIGNRGAADLPVATISLLGLDGQSGCAAQTVAPKVPFSCTASARVPVNATLTGPYWERPEDAGRATFASDAPFGLPFRPTPFKVRIEMGIGGIAVTREVPIRFRYEGPGLVGEKRMELDVVPAFAVEVSPKIVVVPLRSAGANGNGARTREVRVSVVNGNKGESKASVRLKAPEGWTISPASAPVAFTREDEAVTTRFMLSPPPKVAAGQVGITAEVRAEGASAAPVFSTGYQVIEYPHTQRRHKLIPATATVKTIDVQVAPSLSVGYIMGVGDQVPAALQQLGVNLTLIDPDELAWGDLSKYQTIVTGVRAYERRADLRANNHRLLQYVENGGTAIVQYNKMEFNQAQYGPYPAQVSSNRVTDERAPVKVLAPAHQVFTWPNRIDAAAWQGWVQERGLYFLGDKDVKYVDLVEMEDPFEYNKGAKRGALVEAAYGKGRWLYVGLGLWRQLPAGTDGAYELMANLVSLGKRP
ncbi:MAG TPA: PIG-L family deacetylase [Vicinamibacterales bacterium]|nr:PIG-L family deacetylase [Vicinamibacterales bacterium]